MVQDTRGNCKQRARNWPQHPWQLLIAEGTNWCGNPWQLLDAEGTKWAKHPWQLQTPTKGLMYAG